MTCDKCQEQCDMVLDINNPIAYVRIEEANVAIIGCEKHIKILIDRLRKIK